MCAEYLKIYSFFGSELNSDSFSSCHLHLRPVDIIGRIKDDDFFSLIDQTHNAAIQRLTAPKSGHYVLLDVQISESLTVEIFDGLEVVERAEGTHVLMVTCVN